MKLSRLKKIIYFLHWGSFDICLGVISVMIPLYYLATIKPSLSWFFILPSTVWLIYFLDHFFDSKNNLNPISSRHLFIQKHLLPFKILAITIVLSNAYLVFTQLSLTIIIKSLILVALCITYFLLNYFKIKWFTKEFFAALIYALGIGIYPYLLNSGNVISHFSIQRYCIQLFTLAFINLLQIAVRETEQDKISKSINISNIIGSSASTILLITSYLAAAVLLYVFNFQFAITLAFTVCYIIHLLHFTKITNHCYRIITEYSFMLIGLIYLIGEIIFLK